MGGLVGYGKSSWPMYASLSQLFLLSFLTVRTAARFAVRAERESSLNGVVPKTFYPNGYIDWPFTEKRKSRL
jgi:hypothetical protein